MKKGGGLRKHDNTSLTGSKTQNLNKTNENIEDDLLDDDHIKSNL